MIEGIILSIRREITEGRRESDGSLIGGIGDQKGHRPSQKVKAVYTQIQKVELL
jgi:hypothetical protein